MRLHHFVDEELTEQLKLLKGRKKEEKAQGLEEHTFIATCLKAGLTINDLKELDYIDVVKILVCMIPSDQKYKKATASDWDKLM